MPPISGSSAVAIPPGAPSAASAPRTPSAVGPATAPVVVTHKFMDEVFCSKYTGPGNRPLPIPVDRVKALKIGIPEEVWRMATHDNSGRQEVFSKAEKPKSPAA